MYNQKDAEGFINLFGLPLTIRALMKEKGRVDYETMGRRFEKQTSKEVDDFHSSIHFDYRLYKQDILGSIAHAKMLGKQA